MRVNSTAIRRVRYNPLTRSLVLDFHESGRYVYRGVPHRVARKLAVSRSVGVDYNHDVRGRYSAVKR